MQKLTIKLEKTVLVDDEDWEKLKHHDWYISGSGYVAASNNNQLIYMHRMIMGNPVDMWVDHKNGIKTDNRRSNLRTCNPSQNRANSVKYSSSKRRLTSKFKGVHKKSITRNWSVQIQHLGKRFHLGYFKDEVEAALAYDKKAKELFGEYAHLNFR